MGRICLTKFYSRLVFRFALADGTLETGSAHLVNFKVQLLGMLLLFQPLSKWL